MSDFIARVVAELDTQEAQAQLQSFLNEKNKLKIDVELNQDSAQKLSSSLEKGIKQTKIDTSSISKQLADSFNITDKSTINQIKSQLNSMMSSLSKAWDGNKFDVKNAGFADFAAGMQPLQKTLSENAKLVQSATGIYDDFFNYFKDKKIYVSDTLKKAMGEDNYKELLQNNIGQIVRDAKKGIPIDSIWEEMSSKFPQHFAENITTQADQIAHAFNLMKQARADMTQVITAQDMDTQTRANVDEFAWKQTTAASDMVMQSLQKNIQSAQEDAKTTIDLDVNVNADKITSDIKEAIQNAGSNAGDAMNVDLKVNDEQLTSNLREAISKIAMGDEPLKVDLQVNEESLQSDLNLALTDLDLPVHFKIDADALAAELQAAVNKITDVKIDLHVNTDTIKTDVNNAVNDGGVDTSRYTQLQQLLGNINRAGATGQSTFQKWGGSLKEAFNTYSMANMLQDGVYKVVDAGKQGIETVKSFNDIKTDLAMATGENKTYINDLMQSYNALGQELGSITSDVAQSADSWLRQGRTMSETNQLIKDSMVLSKDAQMSSGDASKVLTSTLNGFQMEADEASHVNDVLTSLDLKSASSAQDIGEGLAKVASMSKNVGLSMEKASAIVATSIDTTQSSGDETGNALKGILSRLNNIKAGKFVDSETGEALNDTEKVLNEVGISMRDVNGQFKDSESILDTVADKWNTFDSNTQKAVATAMAGSHRINTLYAAFENWDKVQMLTETAYNSEGTAQQKFENNYLTSLEAKTNALKASLEKVATSVVSDNMYAGFLDGAKAVADFTAQTDLLKASLVGLGAAGGVYAFGWIQNLIQGFSDLGKAMDILKAGNLTDAGFDSLLNLTKGLSESQAKLLASSTALSEAQRVLLLMNTGMSEAEAQAAVAAMGLSAANGTAAASTVTLSGALSGLWATLMANPLILVAAGVTAAIAAISSYNNSVKEAVSSARESGNAWEENNTSIEDNISRIQELRTELESGTLTEQEAADAKSELLSIQESLTDSYGDQVQGIDLINGSLEQQIKLLDKVSQKESENFLNENKKGIDKATKEMEKNRHNYFGHFYDNGSDESEALKASIQKLQKSYGDEVIKLEKGSDGITMNVAIDADVTTAKDALNDFMTEVSDIEKQYGESDTLELLSDNAAAGLTDANHILEEYQSLYEQAQKAELKSDNTIFSADGKEQTAAKWLSDYAKAVQEYNDAVADGDDTKIKEAAISFNTLDSTMQELSKGSMSEYADQVQEVRDQLNETAIANDKFTKAVKGSDSSDFGKTVSDSVNVLKELNLTDTDFKYAFETEGIQEGEDAVNSLVDAAVQCGVISDTSSEQVGNLVNMLVQLGVISSSTGAGLDTATDSASGLATQIENVNTALSGIEKANSLLNSQSTGQSISIDDFNSDELADYTSALEYNNGALQLNAEKVRELQKAKAEEAIQTNDNQKLEKQNQYMENIAQIEQLQEELRGFADAKSDNAQSIQDNIDALLSENDSIVNQCNQLDLLSASLREATGAYQNWLDKQNASESGDMFDDAMGALHHIEDTTQNTDSEYYGRTGREDYKAAVDFIVPDTIDHEDESAVSSYIDSIEHYFNHDSDGNRTGLDVAEFCAKATKAGLMELDEASGEYKVAGQKTMQDFADGLNLSMPFLQSIFGEMQEFSGVFDWQDEAIKTMGDLGMAAGEAKSRIEEASGDTGMNIQIDVSDIENTEDKISTLDSTIQQMQDYKGTVDVDSSQVDDANAVIQYCVAQKQQLTEPAVMSVDTSQVDGEIGNALSLLQQFQQAQNNVELQAAVGADTSEAQGQVDSLVSEIQGLSPEIQAKLNIDATFADTITASLQGLTPEVMVKAGIDSSLVDAYKPDDKDATVKYGTDTSKPDSYKPDDKNATVTYGVDHSLVDAYNPSNLSREVVYTIKTHGTPPSGAKSSGANSVNGTANVNGTAHYNHITGRAYADGNWSTKTGGTTLVGELGREIVVDPSTGKWHTVGDNGAEFTNIPAGAIVFNHKQSEALLERGFVAGRGKAMAGGSAMVTGGISVKQANIASGKTTYSGSKSSGNSANVSNTNATKANTNATKDNTKSTKKSTSVFDYVARKLTYFANKTKEIADKINDYVSSAFKAFQLQKQISAIGNEITVNSKGANTYLKKANSVKLNAKVKKDIREGKYAITDYNTESSSDGKKTQYEKIQEYAKYYDEYVKCTQAVQDLKNQQLELFEQWANMPTEAAEKKIEKLKAGFNGLTAIQARLKTASLGGSAQTYLNKEMKSSLATATNNRNSAKATLNNATNRLSSANRAYDTAKRNESHVIENADKSKKKAEKAGDKLLSNKSVSLTDSEKKKVASGKTISTKGLSGKKKTAVKKYNTAVKKSNAAKKKASKAKSNTKKASNSISSARSAVTSARSAYQSANDLYQSYATQYDTASKYLNSGDTLGYQNYLTDMEFQNTKEQNKANQKAYAQAKKNTQDTLARQTSAKSAVDKAPSANAKAKSTGKSLVSKYKGKLKQSQINALNSGKKVNIKGTSGALKKKLEAYNKALANSANALKQARAQYDQISTEVDIARNAEAQAAANAAESQAETAQAAIEAEKTKFENVSNYYDKRMDYEKALAEKAEKDRDRNEAHGDYTASGDYDKEISNEEKQRDLAQQKVDALKKQLADAMSSGVVKQGTEEWLEMSTTITEAENSVADLNTTIENTKQKQLTTKYEEMFDRAIAKAEQLISKIDTINDLLTEEMMYDYDTGQLTDMGALSLTLNAQSMNDSLDNLQQYVNKRHQIIKDFANGDKDLSKYGEKTYDELMSENDSNIQNALKNANSYKQQILSIVKTQSQKEQDALFKVIDARKEALKKKRDYYEYDKKIKSSTKEINLLQQQIDALDDVGDAETRAQKARLEAQLKDAQDDLDDTVRDHVYDLQVDGLDDLEDQLKEDFEKWSNELSGNLDKMSQAINDAINNSGASAADAMNTLAEVLKQFNITPDQLGISASNLSAGNIKKYDKGTKHIGHNSVVMTNENGREIIVTDKGWLTDVHTGDEIISTADTAALGEVAEKYRNNELLPNIRIPEIKSDGDRNVVYNYTNNSPVTIQGDLVRDTLPDLKTILKESSKYTQNEMRKNLRRT